MSAISVNKEEKKRHITAAAFDVIASQGVQQTSMSQIAKAAGIGKGTIYEYFSSKQDLVIAAFSLWAEALSDSAEGLVSDTLPPDVRLREYCLLITRMMKEDPKLTKVSVSIMQMLISDEGQGDEFDMIRNMARQTNTVVEGYLREGVEKGLFRKAIEKDINALTINLFAYLDGVILHNMIQQDYFNLTDQVNLYLDGFLASIAG